MGWQTTANVKLSTAAGYSDDICGRQRGSNQRDVRDTETGISDCVTAIQSGPKSRLFYKTAATFYGDFRRSITYQ